MKDLSFYEQAGIVLPGSAVLFGVLYLIPELRPLFMDKGLTVGGLGLFLLLAYALGHLVAAVGNLLELLIWWPVGGMPTTWVRSSKTRLLTTDQLERLRLKMKPRLGLDLPTVHGIPKKEWRGHFGLLYRDVLASGAAGRIETFNGNYGLSRGLAAAMLLLAGLVAVRQLEDWHRWSFALVVVGALYVSRMCRFGLHFAREVYLRFLLLPDART